jgi:hypothetical protein
MNKLFLLITLLFLPACVQAEEYYRSIDNKGKVHYGDAPVKNAADFEKLKAMHVPDGNDALPFETRRANSKFPVTFYVADSCGEGCSQAREFLKNRGIPFTEKNVASAEDIASFKKASGGDHVPAMHIGTDWLSGFLLNKWTAALDAAGYPKTAPYSYHPAAKSAPVPEKK